MARGSSRNDTTPESFEFRWREAVKPGVTATLERLVREFHGAFTAAFPDLNRIKGSLVSLLAFLDSEEGRTDEAAATVDAFVCLLTAERIDLLEQLPPDFQELIDSIGLDLLEAFRQPELGERFGASIEILRRKAEALGVPTILGSEIDH